MGVKSVFQNFRKDSSGQMTVELALALPVFIVVAVIAVNALHFFSLCAAFDRAAHNEVRIQAASPAYGQDALQSSALIEQSLYGAFEKESNIEIQVEQATTGADFNEYIAHMKYHPTLFGMGLRSEVFGVSLPSLNHSTRFVIDSYKPGVLL